MKEISNKNSKGQYHGFQQTIHNNKIIDRGNAKNGRPIGYLELHNRIITNSANFFIR